jgi:hypothetical protein
MARAAADKAEKPHIPEINWSSNNPQQFGPFWPKYIKKENYRVLFGKKDVVEVSLPITLA